MAKTKTLYERFLARGSKMKEIRFFGIQDFGRDFGTQNLIPGRKVYGERLTQHAGKEYRMWDIYRSKIAAAIKQGLRTFPFQEDTKMLYLGAGNGTTVSHFSDILTKGQIFAVEFSARSTVDLLLLAKQRQNIVPLLADANKPQDYLQIVPQVDVIYQDIAQRGQVDILSKNVDIFLKDNGFIFLMVKARSIDVVMEPKNVFKIVSAQMQNKYKIVEQLYLDPYEKDHMCVVAQVK